MKFCVCTSWNFETLIDTRICFVRFETHGNVWCLSDVILFLISATILFINTLFECTLNFIKKRLPKKSFYFLRKLWKLWKYSVLLQVTGVKWVGWPSLLIQYLYFDISDLKQNICSDIFQNGFVLHVRGVHLVVLLN